MLGEKEKDRLAHEGWLILRECIGEDAEATVAALAGALGGPVPSRPHGGLVDLLQPVPPSSARRCSLSRHHGTGRFPFHTDTAHWQLPARYVVLACRNPGRGRRATLLLHFADLGMGERDECLLKSGVFLVRNGRRSWYSTVLGDDGPFIRFDPGCMAPANERGKLAGSIMADRIEAARPARIEWARGDALVVDNWKVLHGRDGADGDDDRLLLRALAMNQG